MNLKTVQAQIVKLDASLKKTVILAMDYFKKMTAKNVKENKKVESSLKKSHAQVKKIEDKLSKGKQAKKPVTKLKTDLSKAKNLLKKSEQTLKQLKNIQLLLSDKQQKFSEVAKNLTSTGTKPVTKTVSPQKKKKPKIKAKK